MTKPNKDGWIRHRGGKQPVGDDVRVEYRLRSGLKYKDDAANLDWSHDGDRSDIMAYKPIYSEFQPAPMIEAPKKPEALVLDYSPSLHIQSFGRAYRAEGDPRVMRDRIREIDATTIALNEERASLVAKLKAEGFALIQSDEPNGAAGSAQQDIAQQDMSDWRNWKRGDLVECVTVPRQHKGFYEAGKHYAVDSIDLDDAGTSYEVDIHCDSGFTLWNSSSDFKWHSRQPQ